MKRNGFTIVELLIVVVVIAILAAISGVAYTNIQDRTNDSAVQSDIINFSKQITLYYAEFGEYPAGGSSGPPTGMGKFPVARGSYHTGFHNFIYCTGAIDGSPVFSVGAVSKSRMRYFFSSLTGSIQKYGTATWGTLAPSCEAMLPGLTGGTYSYGFNTTTQTWFGWTQ